MVGNRDRKRDRRRWSLADVSQASELSAIGWFTTYP